MKDPYKALDVSHDASEQQIKTAFRKIAKECHPDVNGGNPGLTEKFREAAEAYEVLSNKERKAAYDAYYESGEISQGYTTNSFESAYTYETQSEARATEFAIHQMYERIKADRREAIVAFFTGLAFIAGGLIITFGSMMLSDLFGGYYVVTIGLLLCGALGAIKNFFKAIILSVSLASYKREFWESL